MSKKLCFVFLVAVIELLFFISGSNTASASTQLTVSPTSVNFGTVNVGSSAQQSIKITNSGQSFFAIRSVSVSGSYFAITGIATPLPMRAGASFSFTAKFNPSAAGSQTGKVSIVTSSGETVDVTLSGNTPANTVSIVPTSASFGNVPVGSTNSQTFTVTNHGSTTVSVLSKSISGTGLSISGLASGLQIGSGQSSTFNVAFKPAQTGVIAGSASVDFSASGKTIGLTVPVSGNGVAATGALQASPSALSFGDVTVGKSSSLSLKVTNAGNSSVTITRSAVTGSGFSVSGLSALTLQPGQSDSVPVIFAPTSTGSVSGSISIATSSAMASVALLGSGVAASTSTHTVSLSWVASTSTGMAGYYVERGTVSGGPYQILNSSPETGTSYVDSTVQNGTEYFYVVVSVNTGGQESKPSGQVSATIPSS
jgi:Abnormal spindle-like microcephaly-assoc'd, ASPM-SPD-2-Hydin